MTVETSVKQYRSGLTGRRVFYIFLCFFGFISAVNAVFIYFAVESWPGLGTQDSYRKGLTYNQTLDAAQRQQALGWTSAVMLNVNSQLTGTLNVQLNDKHKNGLAGLTVSVSLARPIHEKLDQSIALVHQGGGLYQAPIELPVKGRWQATISAKQNSQTQYRMRHELMVK